MIKHSETGQIKSFLPDQDSTHRISTILSARIELVLTILIALLIIYFGWLSSELEVHYYDGYQYLNNAKALVGLNSSYDYTRPPVLQMLLMPIMLCYRFSGALVWLTRAPFIAIFIINSIALIITWQMMRIGFKREITLILILFLLLNRVVFHYIPFVMPDLLAMGVVAGLAISCHRLVTTARWHHAIWSGCWLGVAIATKHYLAPLCLAITLFLLLEWIKSENGRIKFVPQWQHLIWLIIIALSSLQVVLLLHKVTFLLTPEFRNESILSFDHNNMFYRILKVAHSASGVGTVKSLSSGIGLTFKLLRYSFSLPMLILIIIGAIVAIIDGDRMARLLLLIALVHILALTTIVQYTEARYFLQIYPACYYFVGLLIKKSVEYWQEHKLLSKSPQLKLAGMSLVVIVTLIFAMQGTFQEIISFNDSSYRNDILSRLGIYIRDHSNSNNKVFWVGDFLNIKPKESNFAAGPEFNREYYYSFGGNANAVAYYSDRRAYSLYPYEPTPPIDSQPQSQDLVIVLPEQSETSPMLGLFMINRLWRFEHDQRNNSANIFVERQSGKRLSFNNTGGLSQIENRETLLLWSFELKNQNSIFFDAIPLPPAPATIQIPARSEDTNSLLMIPLDTPINTFQW